MATRQQQQQRLSSSSSSDSYSSSSSDSENDVRAKGGFFAQASARPVTITKSKWFASRIRDSSSGSSDSDSDSSMSDSSSPSESDSLSDSESDSDSDSDSEMIPDTKISSTKSGASQFLKDPKPSSGGKAIHTSSSSDEDSDDSYFDSDSDSDSSDSDIDRSLDPSQRRLRFLKDEYLTGGMAAITKSKPAITKQPTVSKQPRPIKEGDDDGITEDIDHDQVQRFRKVGGDHTSSKTAEKEKDPVAQLLGDANPTNVLEKLSDVSRARGKKTYDRDSIILSLEQLLDMAPFPFQKIKILIALTSCHFDYLVALGSSYLPIPQWKLAVTRLSSILDLLNQHTQLVMREDVLADDDDAAMQDIKQHGPDAAPKTIKGSLIGMVERLAEELTKSLMAMDLGTPEYLDRLRDYVVVYALLVRSETYTKRIGDIDATTRFLLRRLEHAHNKQAQWVERLHNYVINSDLVPVNERELVELHVVRDVDEMASYLYEYGSDRLRTSAVLCHVTYHAIHDRSAVAHHMLLMSGLQDSIRSADIVTQALFNRTLVYIGLAAFRAGQFLDAHTALHELLSPGNQVARELINHGTISPLNLELIEAVYLTASMFLEIPYMAANPFDSGKRRIMAKTFRRQFDLAERSAFQGPPENTRDHIMACARALLKGEWNKGVEFLSAVRVWTYLATPTVSVTDIKDILTTKCKETSLLAWVHQTSATCIESVSLTHLSNVFNTTETRIRGLLTQLIIQGDILAKIDGIHNALVITNRYNQGSSLSSTSMTSSNNTNIMSGPSRATTGSSSSRVHYLTHQLAEKLLAMADANDKLLAARNASSSTSEYSSHHHRIIGGTNRGHDRRSGGNNNERGNHHHHHHHHHHHRGGSNNRGGSRHHHHNQQNRDRRRDGNKHQSHGNNSNNNNNNNNNNNGGSSGSSHRQRHYDDDDNNNANHHN